MCKNIIFLDIDGVLNNDACIRLRKGYVDISCIEFLIDAIKTLDVKIVISSAWRTNTLDRFIQKLHAYNSIDLYKLIEFFHADWRTIKLHDKSRGYEIAEWLSRHTEVTKFICIDDELDFLENQPLLQTDLIHGFGHQESEIVYMFFNSSNTKNIELIQHRTKCQMNVLNRRLNFIATYLE